MVAVPEQAHGAALVVLYEFRDLVQGAEGGEGGLFADVGVAAAEAAFDLGDEVAGHFLRGDVGKGAEGERDGRGGRMVHVAARAEGGGGAGVREGSRGPIGCRLEGHTF